MSKDFTAEEEETFTFAEKLSDKIAEFGGSWWFICSFFIIMAGWICFNVFALTTKVFDPYPFILLNLVLSCISSIQAPLIMMSQNRSEKKDRNRAINNYMVGLKTEIDVRHLHEKVDRLLQIHIRNQNEMHELQIETMHKLLRRLKALEKKITHTP